MRRYFVFSKVQIDDLGAKAEIDDVPVAEDGLARGKSAAIKR
jgi:hypothetical protein